MESVDGRDMQKHLKEKVKITYSLTDWTSE
jgi:hypothetical protein